MVVNRGDYDCKKDVGNQNEIVNVYKFRKGLVGVKHTCTQNEYCHPAELANLNAE